MRRDLLKLRAGRAVALHLGLCLAFLLWPAVVRAQSVAFINPGKSDEIYWVTASQAMEAAAKSLGMNFEVQYAQREPLKTLEIARELAARPAGKRPEYVVITDDSPTAPFPPISAVAPGRRAASTKAGWARWSRGRKTPVISPHARSLSAARKKRHLQPTASFTCWQLPAIVPRPRRSIAIRACAAQSPKLQWSFSNRRFTRPGTAN